MDRTKAFLIGGITGATVGLFFAPRAGVELREKIKEGVKEARKRLREATEAVQERAEGWAESGKRKLWNVQEYVTQIKAKVSPKKKERRAPTV